MAVYYRFKSEMAFYSIPLNVPFISVANLKERIFESKRFGGGKDFDLVVTSAHNCEEYLDEAMLIPKNSSVLIRRVPGWPRMPIVTDLVPDVGNKTANSEPEKSSLSAPDASPMKYPEDSEWDDFGDDIYAIPQGHVCHGCKLPDLQWKSSQDLAAEHNMISSSPFNPYWTGMQPCIDGGLALHPGAQGYVFSSVPCKREFSKYQEFDREMNRAGNIPSKRMKFTHSSLSSSVHHPQLAHQLDLPRPVKRKPPHHHSEGEVSKKRKLTSPTKALGAAAHWTYHHPSIISV